MLDPGDPFAQITRNSWTALEEGMGPGEINTGALRIGDIGHLQSAVGDFTPRDFVGFVRSI
jgi:hypothetical protein